MRRCELMLLLLLDDVSVQLSLLVRLQDLRLLR